MKSFFVCTSLPILSFSGKETLFKLRNVSSEMRRRVKLTLKDKRIVINQTKYDKRMLKLNGFVYNTMKARDQISESKTPLKGYSSYCVKDQTTFDQVAAINEEVRCCLMLESGIKPFHFPNLQSVNVVGSYIEHYDNLTFGRIRCLTVESLTEKEVADLLSKTKRVDYVMLSGIVIETDILGKIPCEAMYIDSCTIKRNITFSFVKYIRIHYNEGFEKLNLPNLVEFTFECCKLKDLTWLSSAPKLKKFMGQEGQVEDCLPYLPDSLVNLTDSGRLRIQIDADFFRKKPRFTLINSAYFKINTSSLKNHSMFQLKCRLIDDTTETLSARFRSVTVDMFNEDAINNHPELLEKCLDFYLFSSKLNLDFLPEKVRKIRIFKCDLAGFCLKRTKKKRF